ncbi:hypothetical protein N0V90_001811 [Kalmusia sp. IMI 367209]|nr:hypothetical protein N0V90_001811 [Kalmusia sp. IMI 367209]
MAQFSITSLAIAFLAVIITIALTRARRAPKEPPPEPDYESYIAEPTKHLREQLKSALPDAVVSPKDTASYRAALNSHWAQQECEAAPACFVQPHDAQQLGKTIAILKEELDKRVREAPGGKIGQALFAIRSGGHSHVPGASTVKGGVVIDLSRLDEISVSDDGNLITYGAGLRYVTIFRALEKRGLAVVGARNESVGVGGFGTGSGYSFYSPQYGFAPSNIAKYEIVLASGAIVTASATENADLWKAVKSGSNNFGIVTQFTARTIPATKVWSGFTYHLYNQADKALTAFHTYVNRVTVKGPDSLYDERACGPITAFAYVQPLNMRLVGVHMAHTKPTTDGKWPEAWKSSHSHLWRLWSSCKVETHEGASVQLIGSNPNGKRQCQATITIKNDAATLIALRGIWREVTSDPRMRKIKNLGFSLVLQPLLQSWATKGDPNVMGLDPEGDPLVIVLLCAMWTEAVDDVVAELLTRGALAKMEEEAERKGTGHRYRFINYAGGWQDVMKSYGEENLEFMRGVSARVDPGGLFQRGCSGGFKLGMEYTE